MIIKAILSLTLLAATVAELHTLKVKIPKIEKLSFSSPATIYRRGQLTATATKKDIFSLSDDNSKLFVEAISVQSPLTQGEKNMFRDILLFTQNIEAAKAEIEASDGRITQKFSSEVFVAHVPQSLDIKSLQSSKTSPHRELRAKEKVAVEAWLASVKDKETVAPETEGLPWDSPGYQAPCYDDNPEI